MASRKHTSKTDLYRGLYEMNDAFNRVVERCQAMQRSGLFKAKAIKLFPAFVRELQAEINQELLNPLLAMEQEDWARHGRVRQRWETYLTGRSQTKPRTRGQKKSPSPGKK
jgi:hypothetical protein